MSVAERLLIDRLIERDEQAFSEIVRLYGDKVFSLIYRMLGNRQEAEDVAQDVFITVFKTIESFRGEAKFSTWLLRIAANHAKNRIKHLARRPTEGVDPEDVSQVRVSVDRPAPPVQARIEGPDAMLEAAQTERLMQESIANLPEDQRLLVVLRDVEEMSYQEIEEITGLPEGTIKSRLHRARTAIKEWLDRHTR
jgi:RNA polymerase sigma-70 factor (ECF subfamily)